MVLGHPVQASVLDVQAKVFQLELAKTPMLLKTLHCKDWQPWLQVIHEVEWCNLDR